MSTRSLLKEVLTATLEPVTPIHVWGGREAIVGIDALVHDNELILVDLEDTLKKVPEDLLKKLNTSLIRAEPKKAVASFLEELKSRELISGLKIPVKTKSRIELNTRIRVQHDYIVPGSELKGYLRTGIIKGLLKKAPDVARIIREGTDLEKEAKNVGIGVEAQLLRTPRLRAQGGFIDALSVISVSDPLTYERVEMSLRELKVAHIPNLDLVASLLAIVFSGGVLKYKITIHEFKKPVFSSESRREPLIKDLEKIIEKMCRVTNVISDKNWLVNTLREFGCDLINIELEKIRGIAKLENYAKLLTELKRDLCGRNIDCIPARIGFMTGHESKTIITEIKRYSPEIYNEVKARMQQELGRIWDALTLKLVEVDNDLVGVGWCKICLE